MILLFFIEPKNEYITTHCSDFADCFHPINLIIPVKNTSAIKKFVNYSEEY